MTPTIRQRPRASDTLRVMRLMADVAALRGDPVRQRQHLIDGLNRLLGTSAGWMFAVDDYRPGRAIRFRAQLYTSDADPDYLRHMAEFAVHNPLTEDPYAVAILHDGRRRQVWTLDDVLPDDAARRRYAAVVEVMNALDNRDGVLAAARTGERGDDIVGFSLHCLRGRGCLGPRGRTIARLAIGEIGRMIENGVLGFGPAAAAELPPRLQQMLVRLVDGRSPKQIAAELNLSLHTVREHLQRLYARHGVATREELMAKFIGGA